MSGEINVGKPLAFTKRHGKILERDFVKCLHSSALVNRLRAKSRSPLRSGSESRRMGKPIPTTRLRSEPLQAARGRSRKSLPRQFNRAIADRCLSRAQLTPSSTPAKAVLQPEAAVVYRDIMVKSGRSESDSHCDGKAAMIP